MIQKRSGVLSHGPFFTVTGCLIVLVLALAGVSAHAGMYSGSYLGGTGSEGGFLVTTAAVFADGSIYVAGTTTSTDIPVTAGAYDTSYNGGQDLIIARIAPDLTEILACTYLGGSGDDVLGRDTVLQEDSQGHVMIAVITKSSDFPITPGAYDTVYHGGMDVAVVRFDADLTSVLASTYLAGAARDQANNLLVASNGDILVSGLTRSEDFPVTSGAYDESFNGSGGVSWGGDIFVSRLTGALDTLLASTFIGGDNYEYGGHMVLTGSGDIYLTGGTASLDYPTTAGAHCRTHHGTENGLGTDTFVTRINGGLTAISASTYLGGTLDDWGYTLCLDTGGNVIITGHTSSEDYPVTPGSYDTTFNGLPGMDVGDDLFITRMDAALSTVMAATYMGGTHWDAPNAVCVLPDGDIVVAGQSASSDFPVTSGTFQQTYAGGSYAYGGEVFAARFTAGLNTLKAATFLGGEGTESIGGAVPDGRGGVVICGTTNSSGFPCSPDAFDPDYNGGSSAVENGDLFVSVLDLMLEGDRVPTPTPTPTAVWYALIMQNTQLVAGDTFLLVRDCGNPTGAALPVDEYIILDVFGEYWFWPGWSQSVDWSGWILEPGAADSGEILTFEWPSVTGTVEGLRFWGAFLRTGTTDLETYTWIDWGYTDTP